MAKKKQTGPKKTKSKEIFTLKVDLIDGPVDEAFADANPEVYRTIVIRGDQTLAQLHEIIFTAFDRFDEHLYQFEFVKEPNHHKNRCYVLPFDYEEGAAAGTVKARLSTLDLTEGQKFFYWFDFGDDWWHEIEVLKISNEAAKGKYPRVIDSVGESPPQYDHDEFDDEDEFADELAGELLAQGAPGAFAVEEEEDEFGEEPTADTAILVAEMHLKNEEFSKAIVAFTRAIEMNPTVDAFEGRAKACRALAEQDEQLVKQMR